MHLAAVVPAPPGSEGTAGAGAPRGAERSLRKWEPKGAGRGAGMAPPGPDRACSSRPGEPPPHTMSQPEGMEGSRGAPHSLAPPPQPAQGSPAALPPAPPPTPLRSDEPQSGRPCPLPCPPGALPAFPLLGLALLQVGLGGALVGLSFAMVWLGSAGQVKNACSAWAGSSAMLCGIFALTTCKRSVIILNRLLVVMSFFCVPLSLTGFILGCQGIEFVSRVPRCNLMDKENKICFCCEELNLVKCTEAEMVLKLYHVNSCISAHLLLKKVLLGLCVLNALITTVCLTVVVLHYWQVNASRRCQDELQMEDQGHILDPDDFVLPVPPPSYSAACNSDRPRRSPRTLVGDELSLPNVYATRINGAEVFFHVEPPPPYEDVHRLNTSEQGRALQVCAMKCVDLVEESAGQDSQAEEICESSSRASPSPSNESCRPAGVTRGALSPLQKQSRSDSVLLYCHSPQGEDTCPGGHVIESPRITFQI